MMNKRKIINLILAGSLLLTLPGCQSKKAEEDIMPVVELIEPVGTVLNYERASFRDLTVVSTYSGVVCPDAMEYTYESDLAFSSYAALPGDPISAGDPLFYSESESIDDDVEKVEDENAELVEGYADYLEDYVYDLNQAKKAEYKASVNYQGIKNYEPENEEYTSESTHGELFDF